MSPKLVSARQIALQFNLDRIFEVFKNPRVHPREALFLVGIGFITALILLILFALLFLRTPEKEKKRRQGVKLIKERKIAIFLTLTEVFLVILVITIASASMYVDQPIFCRSCHEMEKSYFSWETSSHAKTSCLRCHQTPGLIGYMNQKAGLFQMIIASQAESFEKPILADVDNKSCMQCHQKETSEVTESLGIRVKHDDFLNEGYKCTGCHNTAGHGDKVVNPNYPTMDTCAVCHNSLQVSTKCSLCHVSDIGKNRRAERRDFPRAPLQPIPCDRCHQVESCNECHGVEMPHPAGWTDKATHAKASAFEKKEVCEKCHDIEFCNRCHKFPGHGPNFKQEHSKITTRDKQQGCQGCHNKLRENKDYCGLCHP